MIDLSAPKVQPQHLDRAAVVYVRQSDPKQSFRHPESVLAQRRLRDRILEWGWPENRIQMLEGDQGKSATTTDGRDDFRWLLSEIALGHVGIVAGFQINRLAREDEAICHLIKLCRTFDTLVADQDGLYHLQNFNDRLVLTIKGVVGGVELHQIQQRMQHGRLERARRGEWLSMEPMGYVVGDYRKLALHPDEQVQHAVRQVFVQFDRLGSVSAVLRYFHDNDLRLPVHDNSNSMLKERIDWRRAHRATICSLLRHPLYAGAFTWGRRRADPTRAIAGRRGSGLRTSPPEQCEVFLLNNHPAYIDWESYQRNLQRLSSHRRRGPEPSGKRELVSLLAGRVFCGRCGARMQTRYAPRLRYECARRLLDYGEPACASLPGEEIERLAAEQILVALEPASLQLSLAACNQLEATRSELDRHWKLRLERAQHDAARMYRQYDAAEPENRLVVRTLEHKWEESLQVVRTLQEDYHRYAASRPATLSAAERQSILELSENLPRLWNSPTVSTADRRRVVQLLLEKAVVAAHHELLSVELHWIGGTVTHHEVMRRVHRWSELSNYEAVIAHIEEHASRGETSSEIASSLNAIGFRTCRRTDFTPENVRQLRSRKMPVATEAEVTSDSNQSQHNVPRRRSRKRSEGRKDE